MKINALQTSRINLHAQLTSMCSLEKQVGIRTVKGGGWGGTHMEAMDPTSSSCWTLRDDTGSLCTRQRRDKQLVLIIGLISDVRGDEEEEEAATAAVHTPHPHELPFALRLSSASPCVSLPRFKYFVWVGTNQFPKAPTCPCVSSGGTHVCRACSGMLAAVTVWKGSSDG